MAQALLYALTAFAIGRVHELFGVLTQLRIVQLVGIACVIATLMTPSARRRPVLMHREVRIVLGMGALALMLLPFGVWPGGSLRFLLDSYTKVVGLLLLVVTLATDMLVVRRLIVAMLTGMGLLGLFTVTGAATMTAPQYAEIVRAYAGGAYDPNDVAMMMVMTLPFAALGVTALPGAGRVLAVGVAAIGVLATLMTVSRSGFIGLALVSILLQRRLRSPGMRLLTAATIVVLIAVAAPGAYWERIETIWNPEGTGYMERGVWTRLEVWGRGLHLLFRNPLTGLGIGMYEVGHNLVYGRTFSAHNSFLQLAAELGLIGFALFVALLVVCIGNARRTVRAARVDPRLSDLEWVAAALEMALYAYIVVGFTLSQAYAAMLYFLVGVSVALKAEVERRQRPRALPATGPSEPLEELVPASSPAPSHS